MSADELIALEREGWEALTTEAGADYYRERMTEDGLMAFPFGVMNRDQVVESLAAATPWESFELNDVRVIELTEDSGTVVYSAVARRPGGEEFRAVMSSTFVRRDGRWQLAFHQQSFS